MPTVADVCEFLDRFAPAELAEQWDNVGLLVGRSDRAVQRVMTCLTITPASAEEAAEQRADLVIAHHPLPFRPLKRITSESIAGQLLLRLIESGVAVYSPHTAFDSAQDGINRWLSEIIGIADPQPLQSRDEARGLGAGRRGELFEPMLLKDLALRLKFALGQDRIQLVGDEQQRIERAAVGCGSAGELLRPAMEAGCELFVTGEASFHTCLEASANHVAMILVGHYASERFAVDRLADILGEAFADITVWASRDERDPIHWM